MQLHNIDAESVTPMIEAGLENLLAIMKKRTGLEEHPHQIDEENEEKQEKRENKK